MANDSQTWKNNNHSPDYFTWTSILFSQRPIFDDTGGGGGGARAGVAHNDNDYNEYADVVATTPASDDNRTTPSFSELFVSSVADIAVNATTAVIDENLANNSLYYQVKSASSSSISATNDTELFDGGSGGGGVELNEAKVSAGGNFAMILDDFNQYFYNYNGTGFNESSISNLPFNCSGITNGTNCPDTQEGKCLILCNLYTA